LVSAYLQPDEPVWRFRENQFLGAVVAEEFDVDDDELLPDFRHFTSDGPDGNSASAGSALSMTVEPFSSGDTSRAGLTEAPRVTYNQRVRVVPRPTSRA